MAAPSLFDGVSRAIEEVGVPSAALIGLIIGIRYTYGGREAGITYVALTVFVLLGIYAAAKYWNTRYTLGFVVAGILLWGGVPGVMPHLVPTMFADLGRLVVLVFLILITWRIADKVD
jgi:hypothetical protein